MKHGAKVGNERKLPGQGAKTHSAVSQGCPISEQFFPAYAGGGLVQLRDLFLTPTPQDP